MKSLLQKLRHLLSVKIFCFHQKAHVEKCMDAIFHNISLKNKLMRTKNMNSVSCSLILQELLKVSRISFQKIQRHKNVLFSYLSYPVYFNAFKISILGIIKLTTQYTLRIEFRGTHNYSYKLIACSGVATSVSKPYVICL